MRVWGHGGEPERVTASEPQSSVEDEPGRSSEDEAASSGPSIVIRPASEESPRISVERRSQSDWRCPYCHDQILAAPLVCPDCKTMTHRACTEEAGGCITQGCEGDPLDLSAHEPPPEPGHIGPATWRPALLVAAVASAAIAWYLFWA